MAVGSKMGKVVAATLVVAAHSLGFYQAEMHDFAETCTYVPEASDTKVSQTNVADMFLDEIDDFDDSEYEVTYADEAD